MKLLKWLKKKPIVPPVARVNSKAGNACLDKKE